MAVFRRFCRIICGAVFALCVVLYSALGYDQFQYEDNCQEWDPALGMYVNVPCSGGGGGGAVTTSTVTLDGNGGTVPSAGTTITATYGLAMPTITSDKLPTRTGYTFIGYYDATTLGTQYYNASGTSVKTWDKTGAQTLYAHWTPNIYQITFNKNANDATLSGTSPLYVKYNSANVFTSLSGSTIGTVPTATQSGYAFNGWYTAASGGSQVYDAQGVLQKNVSGYTSNENSPKWITTTAQTLYAQWTEDTSSSCPSGQISETGSITIVGYLSDNFCSQNELGQESASDIMSDFYRRGYQGACGIEGQDTHFFETYCSNNNHHAKWFAQDNNGIILFGESTCIDHANTTESGIDTNLVTQNNLLTGSDCWCRIAGFGDGEGGSIPFSPESSWYYQQLIDPYSLYSAEEKSKPTTDLSRCAMLCSNACASQVVQSFSANNRYSNTTQSSAFYNSVTGSAQICRSPVFNVVYNGGGNTGGSAPSKPTSCTYGGTCNAPSNRYIKTGYTFNGWACTSSSGSCAQATYAAGESIANATSVDGATITLTAQWIQTPISCSQNQILTEDGCQDAEFIVTTTSDTGASFSFRIAAAGRFYVDCVGGTSLSGNGVIAGTNIIDRANNVTEALYTCNWASSGEHVIRFGGHADGYNDNYYYSAIKFPFTDGIHGYRIRKISGSLGHIFGTVENPTIGVGQPCFYATFKDQSMMEGTDINDPNNTDPNTNLPMKYALPPNLFDGVSGEPREGIFFNTFNGCSGMTGSIPPRLFGDLNGEYKREIFDNTFYGCSGLTGPFPSTLFSGLYGDLAQGTFGNTFNGCSGLTGAISSNMFGRYSGQPAANMFSWTFYGCSGLNGIKTGNVTTGYIPESFLRDIVDSQLQYQANGMFTGTGLGPCPTGYVDVTRAQFSDAGKPWCALGKYAITFNANNGTLSGTNPLYTKYNDSDIYADAEATSTGSLPTITRTGYTFNGWYTAASGGSQVYNASGVLQRNVSGYTSDESTPKWITTTAQTLYAQWTPNTYGITYDKQGGQVYGSFVSQHTPGTTTVLGSNTGSKTGYRFDYWCVDSTACTSGTTIIRADQVPANGNTFTLYAVWVPETYAITFNANEGTLSGTNPLYAKYNDANIYTTSSATTTGSLPTVTRTEYIFNGWYTAASGGSQVYNASGVLQKNVTGYTSNENSPKWITTSPQTLYAQWTANTYAITFDKNANDAALSGTNPLYAKYNDANIYTTSSATTTGSLPTVTRTGYIFNGWYTAASGGSQVYNSSGVLQKNVTGYTSNENSPKWTTTSTQTLYAQWAQNAYTITYNLDGGSGCSDTTYSGTTTLCEPTRTGYSFDGWATSAGGAVAYASGSSVTNVDLTLYAKWTPNTYAITFNANEGTLSGTNPLYAKYNDASIYTTAAATTTGTLPTATRNGYTFNGWYTASSDGSQVYNASGVLQKNISGYTSNDDAPKWITTSTQTLYAQWTSNSCTVTFKTGDATMGTQNFTFGTAQALTGVSSLNNTPVNSATGWLFYGWTTNTNTSTRIYTDGQSISDLCADGNNVTLYGIWKRDASFTYYANAGSTTPTTSQQTQYYYNTDTSTANTTSVNVPTLYDQTTYGWNAFGWWGSPSVPTSDSDITINKTEISINPGINNNYDFYAIYKRPVSLTYNTNGGSGTMANTTDYQYFSAALPTAGTLSLTLSNNGFTAPNGYSFDKWAAGSVSGDQYSEDASFDFPNRSWTSSDSYNMYAIWSANTIVFNWQNGGRGTAPTTPASCAYGESFDMPAAMTYAGYTFDKWNTNGNTNTQFNAGATVSCTYDNLGVYGGQTTITGSWTSNIYNVAYNCGAGARGNAPAGTTVTFDTLFQVADNNTCAKDGYVFDGWTVSGTNDVKHANDEFIWNYAEDKTFTVKWKLAFCPKNQYLENDSCKICSVETNGVYPYSEARSTSIDDCYTPCTSENANIDNATEFSGLVYHDGKKTCQPVSCVLGYHVDTVNPVLNTIVGTNSVNGSVAQINVTGNFSETGASKGQAYYGITANNSFAVDYLHKGVLTGQAVCSSHIGTNNNYSWSDPTIVRDSSTLSTTGGNCYCKSEKWKAEGEEEFKDLTSYWVFQLDAGNNCGATCASECASAMLYTTAFRSVAFDMLDSFGSRCDFNNYNVTYNCGEGSGTPQPLTAKATYTKSFTPAANTCTKQGYEFKGWLVSNTNDHIKQAGESFAWNYTENKTFTAQWGSKTYTVEYNCGTGSGTKPADETAIFDEAFAPAVNTCSNAGYDFDGWLVSNTNNHKKYENIQFVWDYEENKTFTAQWVPHTYTITYD